MMRHSNFELHSARWHAPDEPQRLEVKYTELKSKAAYAVIHESWALYRQGARWQPVGSPSFSNSQHRASLGILKGSICRACSVERCTFRQSPPLHSSALASERRLYSGCQPKKPLELVAAGASRFSIVSVIWRVRQLYGINELSC